MTPRPWSQTCFETINPACKVVHYSIKISSSYYIKIASWIAFILICKKQYNKKLPQRCGDGKKVYMWCLLCSARDERVYSYLRNALTSSEPSCDRRRPSHDCLPPSPERRLQDLEVISEFSGFCTAEFTRDWCFILSCTAEHNTAASNALEFNPSKVIGVPFDGSLHLYVKFNDFILSSGIPHRSRICRIKSANPSGPVRTWHRNEMLLNLTMMSPLISPGAAASSCGALVVAVSSSSSSLSCLVTATTSSFARTTS